jgi:hypothetical protein
VPNSAQPVPTRARGVRDPAVRAAAVAALAAGESLNAISRRLGVGKHTLAELREQAGLPARPEPVHVAPIDVERPAAWRLAEQVARYISRTLTALENQALLFGDEEWIRRQDPAILLGVHEQLVAHADRFLAMVRPAGEEERHA